MADVGDRGVSPVLAYTLTLGIGTLLVAGLVLAASGYVDTQREVTAESELRVVGQQVSADMAAADRLSRADEDGSVSVARDLPPRVVGSQYTIHLRDDGDGPTDPYLELSAVDPDVTVKVGLAVTSEVEPTTASGGRVVVTEDEDGLVIRNV